MNLISKIKNTLFQRSLPFKMPIGSGIDPHEINPATGQPDIAKGLFYLGKEIGTNQELWLSKEDISKHTLLFSELTQDIQNVFCKFMDNIISINGGGIYFDLTGNVEEVYKKINSSCQKYHRDSPLVLSFSKKQNKADIKVSGINPFKDLNASSAVQLLMEDILSEPGDDFFKELAYYLGVSIFTGLFWLRDNKNLLINVKTLKEYLTYDYIIQLASNEEIPYKYRKQLINYIENHILLEKVFTLNINMLTHNLERLIKEDSFSVEDNIDFMDIIKNKKILIISINTIDYDSSSLLSLMNTLMMMIYCYHSDFLDKNPKYNNNIFSIFITDVTLCRNIANLSAQARALGLTMFYGANNPLLLTPENSIGRKFEYIIHNTSIKIILKNEPSLNIEVFKNLKGDLNNNILGVGYISLNDTTVNAKILDDKTIDA